MSTTVAEPGLEEVLTEFVAALRSVADYRLPAAIDRRFLWLSENQERLSVAERDELTAAVEFAEDRTLEKLQAQAAPATGPAIPPSRPEPAMTLISTSLRDAVVGRAAGCCEFCRLSQETQVATFPVDHIRPVT